MQTSDSGDESSTEEIDHVFEAENCQRLETPSWCKCEHCTLKPRTIELFNGCCDEALEYDEYDASLKDTDAQL